MSESNVVTIRSADDLLRMVEVSPGDMRVVKHSYDAANTAEYYYYRDGNTESRVGGATILCLRRDEEEEALLLERVGMIRAKRNVPPQLELLELEKEQAIRKFVEYTPVQHAEVFASAIDCIASEDGLEGDDGYDLVVCYHSLPVGRRFATEVARKLHSVVYPQHVLADVIIIDGDEFYNIQQRFLDLSRGNRPMTLFDVVMNGRWEYTKLALSCLL